MVKINVGRKLDDVKKGWKETVVKNIERGYVLPFVSNSLTDQLLFENHDDVIESWADYVEYPIKDTSGNVKDSLARICQYVQVMKKADPNVQAKDTFVKEAYLEWLASGLLELADTELADKLKRDDDFDHMTFAKRVERLELSHFDDSRDNPFLLLADMKLPIYVTTSYHTLLESALHHAGATPHTEFCRWKDELRELSIDSSPGAIYKPSSVEPMVFHLFGVDTQPGSLVITEDDHLEFVYNIAKNQNQAIPAQVRMALGLSSLVLLGYCLRDWDFRALFLGIIKPNYKHNRPKSVAIQLEEDKTEWAYLKNYLAKEADFDVFRGDASAFLKEIHKAWRKE